MSTESSKRWFSMRFLEITIRDLESEKGRKPKKNREMLDLQHFPAKRREWDSNPRTGYPMTAFRVRLVMTTSISLLANAHNILTQNLPAGKEKFMRRGRKMRCGLACRLLRQPDFRAGIPTAKIFPGKVLSVPFSFSGGTGIINKGTPHRSGGGNRAIIK